MKVYEIFFAELGAYAKFKVLDPNDVEALASEFEDLSRDDYVKKVIERVVYNIQPDILESLRMMSRSAAKSTVEALFNGCVMLNPGLDIELWVSLTYSLLDDADEIFQPIDNIEGVHSPPMLPMPQEAIETMASKKAKPKRLTKAKFSNLERFLKEKVIGQDQAIEVLVNALKRSQVGLNDEGRPLGVFLFSGSSGVGKTHLARELHKYLYGTDNDIVRIDCGEYQHKHDNQKLIGAPPGYIGHEDGGQLANSVRNNPDTVILLDEVEKANRDIWNTFLRVFDEGILTDNKGRKIDFRNTVIIMTTNLGNDSMTEYLTSGGMGFTGRGEMALSTKVKPPRAQIERVVNEAVKKKFSPEFLNRIDQTIVFNYLEDEDYIRIADLEMQKIDDKLSKRGIVFKWDERVLDLLIDKGVDSIRGARGMSQVRREKIENLLADKMMASRVVRGTIIELTVVDDDYVVSIVTPEKNVSED